MRRAVAHQFGRRQSSPISRARSSRSEISPDRTRTSFSIQACQAGHRSQPRTSTGRAYPGNLLQLAVEKGEVAGVFWPPIRSLISGWKDSAYKEVASKPRRRVPGQVLLHRRITRQPGPRGAAGRARPLRKRCWMPRCLRSAEPGTRPRHRSSPTRPRLRAQQDLQAMVRYHNPSPPPRGRGAQAGN